MKTNFNLFCFNRVVFLFLFLSAFCFVLCASPPAEDDKQWPDVLLVDDFEKGSEKWVNDDTGTLTLTSDTLSGKNALLWTAGDDGLGKIIFKNLDRENIDFSQYDILRFRLKISGKNVWNINPVIQQYPAVYGFRGLFYTIDTLYPFDRWYNVSVDLTRWENAWPDSFSAENQEFMFEIHQVAGAEKTQVFLDDIRLLKNPLGVQPSYHPVSATLPDGTQVNHFTVTLTNQRDVPVTARLSLDSEDPGDLNLFKFSFPEDTVRVLSGETAAVRVEAALPAGVKTRALYAETARVAVSVEEIPGLTLFTELTAAVRPESWQHPSIMCDKARMLELQAEYSDPARRKDMPTFFTRLVTQAEKLLSYNPEYPPLAATGLTSAPDASNSGQTGRKLVEISVPNLPFRVYQDPETGIPYSGPLFDAGMQGYLRSHMLNAQNARALGLAYLVSGRKEFAAAAARILKGYVPRYLELPIVCIPQGSPVGSAASGSVRIGGTFMRERVWLTQLATAMDCIMPSGALSEEDTRMIRERVFVPSAANMMNHKVGLMNLQWQIQSAALFAGLAAEDAALAGRSVFDRHGIAALMDGGFLDDGNWWENPSYQNVMRISAFPAMAVAFENNIIPYDASRMDAILLAPYKLHGPDGLSPTLGTGGNVNLALCDQAVHLMGHNSSHPEIQWIMRNKRKSPGLYGIGDMALFRPAEPSLPEEETRSPIPDGAVVMPDYGGVAMRIPETDMYCYVHYGRELVHGHRNKLSFQAYGKGGWFARNVMGGYEHNFYDFLETVASANTVVVDGQNADHDTGELLAHTQGEGFDAVVAREVGAWKDVEHRRAVVLTRGPLIIIDRCASDSEHTYDWLMHTVKTGLKLDETDLEPAPENTFGDSKHYTSLTPRWVLPTAAPVRWARKDSSGLVVSVLPQGELYSMTVKDAFGSKRDPAWPFEGLFWRQRGKTAGFAAALRPFSKDEQGSVSIEPVKVVGPDKKTVGLDQGQAVRVVAPEGTYLVLVNDSGRTLKADSLSSNERISVLFEPPDDPQ